MATRASLDRLNTSKEREKTSKQLAAAAEQEDTETTEITDTEHRGWLWPAGKPMRSASSHDRVNLLPMREGSSPACPERANAADGDRLGPVVSLSTWYGTEATQATRVRKEYDAVKSNRWT